MEGIVHQETNFPFEVFVHDDASEDLTASVIREYCVRYPDIIKPIFQSKNQYSQGVNIFATFIYPHIQGEYVAVCEGDDYWCNNKKLQKQADWLEKHTEYVACVHNTQCINCITGKKSLFNKKVEEGDIKIEEILFGGGAQFHTSSLMFRKEYSILPPEFVVKGIGDYPKAIYLSICGKIHYFPQVMSVYRMYAKGSWTSRTYAAEDSVNKIVEHKKNINMMLNNVDLYTDGRYSTLINIIKRKNEFDILSEEGDLKKIRTSYNDILKEKNFFRKVAIIIKCKFPMIVLFYRRISKSRR